MKVKFSDNFISKKLERMIADRSLKPKFPREIFFDLSNICNHTCFFCSNSKISEYANMDKELAFRLLKEAKENGVRDVGMYSTGEPFVRKDLADFVNYAKKIGIEYVFINTNGSLATPERSKPILHAGLDSVKFSINAGTRESYKQIHGKDHFIQVIENLKWFYNYRKESGLDYGIYLSMVPTKQTQGEWDKLNDIIGNYLDQSNLRHCSNQGGNMIENNDTEKIDRRNLLGSRLPEQINDKVICTDPFFRAVITPQGFLTACVVDYGNNLCVADLNKTSLIEAWNNSHFVKLRRKHLEDNLDGLICKSCINNCNSKFEPLVKELSRPTKN